MTRPQRDHAHRRLLRWYPAGWRDQHGEVLLGMLADEADASGADRLTAAQAWSLRVHGLGQRLDARLASWLSAAGLGTAIVGGALLLLPLDPEPWVASCARLGGVAALALAGLALAALLRVAGVLTGPAAVWAALASLTAWTLAAAAVAAWALGFDEADAGRPLSGFSAMAVPLAVSALVSGTAALAPVWASVLSPGRARRPRWLPATLLALLCAAGAGAVSLQPSAGVIAAATVLLVSTRAGSREVGGRSPQAGTRGDQAPGRTVPTPARAAPLGLGWVLSLALLTASGLACIGFALVGAELPGTDLDGTGAMNAGLAAGSFVAIPIVLSAAGVVSRRFPDRPGTASPRVVAALVALGLGIGGASQMLGADSPLQWAVLLAATLPMGAAAAVVTWSLLSAIRGARLVLAAAIGAAAAIVVGVPAVITAPFWAPVLSGAAAALAAARFGRRIPPGAVASPA